MQLACTDHPSTHAAACATTIHRKSHAMRSSILAIIALSAVLLCDWLATGAAGQMRPSVTTSAGSPTTTAPTRSSVPAAKLADRRDALLMLAGGPIHLRMHLALGGVSLAQALRPFVTRL